MQTAFRLFNRIMRVPGKGELTMVELRVRVLLLPFSVPCHSRSSSASCLCCLHDRR